MQEDIELPLNFQFKLKNPGYMLVIRQYLFGQWRLQLCDGDPEDVKTQIVREACTYKRSMAIAIKERLILAQDPVAFLESLAAPWNCTGKGGRIRLDSLPPGPMMGKRDRFA